MRNRLADGNYKQCRRFAWKSTSPQTVTSRGNRKLLARVHRHKREHKRQISRRLNICNPSPHRKLNFLKRFLSLCSWNEPNLKVSPRWVVGRRVGMGTRLWRRGVGVVGASTSISKLSELSSSLMLLLLPPMPVRTLVLALLLLLVLLLRHPCSRSELLLLSCLRHVTAAR